jgi:hypothetical protein
LSALRAPKPEKSHSILDASAAIGGAEGSCPRFPPCTMVPWAPNEFEPAELWLYSLSFS